MSTLCLLFLVQTWISAAMPILTSLSASSQVVSNSCAIIVGYHDKYSSSDDDSSSSSSSTASNEVVEEVLEQNFQLQEIKG